MTIEQLAEMARETYYGKDDAVLKDIGGAPADHWIPTVQAIATAVLGPVTIEEKDLFDREYETKSGGHDVSCRAGINAILSRRLASLTQSKQPADASKADVSDDEVERVAKALAMGTGKRFEDICKERERQDAKWGEQNHPHEVWLAVISEEVGELSQEILRLRFGNDKEKHSAALREELVQVAAVAVAWLECIDRNALPHLQRGVK